MYSLQKMCPITCIDSYYDAANKSLILLFGDEMGHIRMQDISSIFKEVDI